MLKLHHILWRPNPWAGGKCGSEECFPCRGDRGGDCRKQGVTYRLTCTTCQEEGNSSKVIAAYEGETGRNGFDRGKEHLAKLKKKCEENSVLWLHSLHHHDGRDDIKYTMQVTGVFREPLDRQLTENKKSHFKVRRIYIDE